MSTHSTPTFALPSNPQKTLSITKYVVSALGFTLLLAGGTRVLINQSEAKSLATTTKESLQRSVIAVHPRPGEKSHKLVLPASLRGNTETQIYARTNGYLSTWHKTIGDIVKKGELLAVIDVPELEQELAQAHAAKAQIAVRLGLAQSTLKRWEVLKQTGSAIEQEYDEKRAAVLQAQADLAAAEVNVKRLGKVESYRRIVAPFSGVVTRRSVDVGSLVSAGTQELFALTQIDPLRLTVWVPQVYANEIKPGQEVAVSQAETRGKPLAAHVEHIAGALDPVNRSRQIDITLPNSEGKLLPGAYVEVAVNVADKASPLIVPANVLAIDKDGTHIVTVDAQGKIAFRPVTLGHDFGRDVEIIEGISANDVLVASPSDLLVEGELVKTVEAKQKAVDKAKKKEVAKS